MKTAVLAIVLGTMLAAPAFSQASSPTNPNNISANVLKVCTVSAFNVSFGDYDASSPTAKTPTGTPAFTVRCTMGTTYTVVVGNGTNYTTTRRMRLGATTSYLDYNLGHTPPTGGGTGTGLAQSYTVTGNIPIGQWVAAGAYSDTVVVTVTY